MATHSSILAWIIPWTEQPGRLQSIELQRFGHNSACLHAMRIMLSIFSYTGWPFIYLHWKLSIQALCQFLYSIVSCYWVVWTLYIFWISTPYQYTVHRYCYQTIAWLFIWLFLSLCRSLLVCIVPFIYILFPCLCFMYHIQKSLPSPMSKSFYLYFLLEFLWFLVLHLSLDFVLIFVSDVR